MLVPLADCLNHDFSANMTLSLLEKTLHKSMNKIYLYKHNFEKKEGDTDEDSVYDKKNSKIKINCAKLFREDEIAQMPEEVLKHWRQEIPPQIPEDKLYSRDLCIERFQFNKEKHTSSLEESKF